MQAWMIGLLWFFAFIGIASTYLWLRSWWRRLPGGGCSPPHISILLVVKDGGDRIEGLLRLLITPEAFGWRPSFDYEIVVVDARSQDDTRAILTRMARQAAALRVFRVPLPPGKNGGYCDPLRYGIFLCRGRAVMHLDLREPGRWQHAQRVLAILFGAPTRGLLPGRLGDP
ncbi:MAG: hypothetical protein WD535_05955 [Thermaerobacterales bacterium]